MFNRNSHWWCDKCVHNIQLGICLGALTLRGIHSKFQRSKRALIRLDTACKCEHKTANEYNSKHITQTRALRVIWMCALFIGSQVGSKREKITFARPNEIWNCRRTHKHSLTHSQTEILWAKRALVSIAVQCMKKAVSQLTPFTRALVLGSFNSRNWTNSTQSKGKTSTSSSSYNNNTFAHTHIKSADSTFIALGWYIQPYYTISIPYVTRPNRKQMDGTKHAHRAQLNVWIAVLVQKNDIE